MGSRSPLGNEIAVRAAVAQARSLAEVCRLLGLSDRGANISRAREACARFGLQLPGASRHPEVVGEAVFRPVRRGAFSDRERVTAAAEGAVTYREILERMGVSLASQNYRRLEAVAAEYGLDLPQVRPTGGTSAMSRPVLRRSILWNREALSAALDGAESRSEVLRRLGHDSSRGAELARAAEHFGLELPKKGRGGGQRGRLPDLEKILVVGAKRIPGQRLKAWLVAAGLLKDECVRCGIGPNWHGQPLVLQLDHENGDPLDNRLENLRILCPNCHSQTETWCGRNVARREAPEEPEEPEEPISAAA